MGQHRHPGDLHRRLYLGGIVYGRTKNEYRKGRRLRVAGDRPVTVRDERLRIISDELWQAAHARMEATHDVYLRRTGGKLHGKPESGLEAKYLLTGFLRCGVCGGGMMINERTGKRGRPQLAYVCATHRTRPGACPARYGCSPIPSKAQWFIRCAAS